MSAFAARLGAAAFAALACLAACAHGATVVPAADGRGAAGHAASSKQPIAHVVIIIQENRSFDNLFQHFPGADTAPSGLASNGKRIRLRQIPLEAGYDIYHDATTWIAAYDDGKMDGFDKERTLGEASPPPYPQYGYVPRSETVPYWQMAEQYVLADRMFASNIDASFVAHQYLIAAQANREVNYPKTWWGCRGGASDTIATLNDDRTYGAAQPVCQDYQTLGDLLDAKGVSWRYYAPHAARVGGQPAGAIWSAFQAVRHIYDGPDWTANVAWPQTRILSDVAQGKLAQVTWVVPDFADSDHAGSGHNSGPEWVASIVNAVGESPFWKNTAIFVLWDDWGGWYDHVAPAQLDYDGLGFRVPLICISPYAYKGVVSHTQYEFGSLLRFIENNWGLPQLAASDQRATPASTGCLDFSQAPRAFEPIATSLQPRDFLKERASDRPPDDQ